jgi:hypothetical protein
MLIQSRAAASGMRLASASVLFYTWFVGKGVVAIIGDFPFTRVDPLFILLEIIYTSAGELEL